MTAVPIVGLWVRAPGCGDLHVMRENLYLNRDNIKELPDSRPSLAQLKRQHPSLKAALVDDIDLFDDSFFGVTESEALFMDPQQRLLLQGVVHALEDAGITLEMVNRFQPAVYTASWTYDYKDLLPPDQYMASGNSAATMCGRISYFFNSRGASVGVETACSSSLVALHLARQSILIGESQLAIVCGANHIGARSFNSLYQSHMVSPDGRSASFDRSANGFVRAESFTVAIVCSETFAKEHGLRIRAQTIGSAYNNDGRTASLIAPNPVAQHEVQMSSMKDIDRLSVDVVTCHGTGTKLGDQVEITAINKSFKDDVRIVGPKSSLGHGEGSAGLIGVFQSILLMQEQFLPAQLHVSLPIELLEEKSLALVCEEVPAKRVAVSSYGFGGTNSSVVLDAVSIGQKEEPRPTLNVLLLSAKSQKVLEEHMANFADFLEMSDKDLGDILHTTNNRKTFYENRVAVTGKNRSELVKNLREGAVIRSEEEEKVSCQFGSAPFDLLSFRALLSVIPELMACFEKHCASVSTLGYTDIRSAVFFPFKSPFSPLNLQIAQLVAEVSLFDFFEKTGSLPRSVSGSGTSAVHTAASAGFISIPSAVQLLKGRNAAVDMLVGRCLVSKGKTQTKKLTLEDLRKLMEKKDVGDCSMMFTIGDMKVDSSNLLQLVPQYLGTLFVSGFDVRPHASGTIVETPAYPFQKMCFWPSELDTTAQEEEETLSAVDQFDMISVTNRVREVVQSYVTELASDDADVLEGGELDSLSTIEMIEAVGSAFQIQMPFDILDTASTVASLVDYVAETLQKTGNRLPKSEQRKTSEQRRTEIGIISADFKFSGGISSFEDFWEAMLTGKVLTKQMNEQRKRLIGTEQDFQAGLLEPDVSRFDGGFFGISKDEAMFMDPQHRLLLHCAFNAWEKAGQPNMSNGDLFLAVASHSEYRTLAERHVEELDDRLWTGTNHSMMAGRLAQMLGVRGRALVVDSTCSSVASAMEMCLTSMLRDGRDWGVVAATQLILSAPYMHSLRSLLPQDYTKSFSVEAAGFVRSEAVGIFILKRLDPMEQPLLILKAAKAAHSGAVVTPVVASVAKLVEECGPVDYIEGHGTATAVGDSVEAMAYQSAGGDDTIVASSKAQFGHSEAASGLLQICKVIKVLESGTIPAMLHNQLANEHIRSNSVLRLPYITEEKDVSTATVVSFGITGTKTAISARKPSALEDVGHQTEQVLPLSAKTKEGLRKSVAALKEMIRDNSTSLGQIARSLQERKTRHKWRTAVVASSHSDAFRKLNDVLTHASPLPPVFHVPTSAFEIAEWSLMANSEAFNSAYHNFCLRLRFQPLSDPTAPQHRLAACFGLLRAIQSAGISYSLLAASGPACLLLMAHFEVAAYHYINDLLLAYLAGDVRQMKRITRDLSISLPSVKLVNCRGEQFKHARQFVDSCFLEEEPVDFEPGTIYIGELKRPSFHSLHTYRDVLQVLSEQYVAGMDVNWSQFGRDHPSTALPEYPFDMRSHWIPLKETSPAAPNILTVDLEGAEWSHVKDHVINGDVILPGATSIRIIDQLTSGKAICSVDFLAPVMPSSSKIVFEMKDDDGGRLLSADGLDAVSFTTKEEKTAGPTVPSLEMPRKTFKTKEIYDRFSLSALMYQTRFQVLNSIGSSLGKGVAELQPLDRIDILIDGALQAVAMGYLLEQPADHHPWLPFNLEKIKIFNSRPSGPVTVHFTYSNNGAFLNGDASAFDRDGQLVVDIKNVCFRRKEIEGRAAVPSVVAPVKSVSIGRTSDAARAKAKNYVLKWFENSFGWEELDEKAGFFDLGLSSLQAVRLRNYLREEYPTASTTSVFDHPTIVDLSNYLASLEADPNEQTSQGPEEDVPDLQAAALPPSRLFQSPIGVRSAACRLPGGIEDPADFWQLLLMGKNPSSRTPANRIPSRNVLIKGQKYGSSVEGGNFIQKDVSAFDSSFFKISKSEAEMMDPQQRLLLECVEECIENSGDMDMTEVGVFVGLMEKEYVDLMEQQQTTILSMLGSMVAVIAGRVNYVFGSYGPSVTVDTACSSSLVAVEMAVNALMDGRCRRAIVAGVNLILSEKGQGHRSNGKMLSAHGMSLSFDARASGYGRSDGCVVLMLEKVKPTMRYLSTLRGVNVNHGGRSVSLTAPNGVAHKMLLSNLFATSPGVHASVWEAHGTGTSLGDPIEVNTLSTLLQDVVISSAKASLGHGEASAGTCGLLKLSLTLDNDYVPPLIHFHVLNRDIQPGSLRLPIVGEEKDWDIGGISSFGVSGTNAAVLAEKNPQILTPTAALHSLYLLPLSAKHVNSLTAFKKSMTEFVKLSQTSLSDIAGVLSSRQHHNKRAALLVTRGRSITPIDKGDFRPEFSLSSDELDFDLLGIEEISEYFEYLDRFGLDEKQRLLLSLVKFLKNAVGSFKWTATSRLSQALYLLFSGRLDVNEETVKLMDGVTPEKYKDLMDISPSQPSASSISIGTKLYNLKTLLSTLGELFVAGTDVDWTAMHTAPARFVQLPTYPFNRQPIWFSEKKHINEHQLLGTEVARKEKTLEFENQLSPMRHPTIFKHGFTLGDAIMAAVEAASQLLSSPCKVSHLKLKSITPEQAIWLSVVIQKNGDNATVIGKLAGTEVFSCHVESSVTQRDWTCPCVAGEGKVLVIKEAPSTIVSDFGSLLKVQVVYDCPYRALFHLLESRGFDVTNLEIHSLHSLENQFVISEREGSVYVGDGDRLFLEIRANGDVPRPVTLLSQQKMEQPANETCLEPASTPFIKVSKKLEDLKKRLHDALNDVLPEGVPEGGEEGFMEMGMDSLTLVDFVNRLNERYFPDLEISTTDIFDHPSVAELASHLLDLLGGDTAQQGQTVPVKSEVFLQIKSALVDVLPEEPTDDTQGFMEMGMDSLTLVDFVNRLNDKYFPGTEISTTDIFDHPSLGELTARIETLLGGKSEEPKNVPQEIDLQPSQPDMKSDLEEIKKMVTQALVDVLLDEPEDFSVGFMEMGMDSLTLVDFVNRLNERYFPQLEISTTDVFDHPTVKELSESILKRRRGEQAEEVKVHIDSGIGSSEDTSPIEEGPVLSDAFFFVEDEPEPANVDYRMISNGSGLLLVVGGREVGLNKETIAQLKTAKSLSIELKDEKISPETLFLELIDFCKNLDAHKTSLNIHVPAIPTASQYMARAFMKTAAAEKPEIIHYKWTEQLQRKAITDTEINGSLNGFWLISGGLSGIGLSTAKWLVEEGVEGVALISRRTPDEQLMKELDEMRRKAKVVVISADIADDGRMRDELKKLDKIDGVIHCAGVLQDGKLERQNATSFKKVFGPKATGYDVLDRLLTELNHRPSTFISMSSWTSACGNVGQLNYGVANAYLDFKMGERRRNGLSGTSIHWGNWLETGMAANKNIHKILTEHGFVGFSTEEGLQYLKYAILKKPERMMAANVDWSVILEKRKEIRRDLIKEGLWEEREDEDLKEFEVVEAEENLEEEEKEDSLEAIREDLIQMAQTVLKSKPRTNKSFMEMGFTSNTLSALLEQIKTAFNVKLTVAVFYEHPTLDELAEHLAELVQDGSRVEKQEDAYIDALSIFYDNVDDWKGEVQLAKAGKGAIRRKGTYVQQIQGTSIQQIMDNLDRLEFKEEQRVQPGKLVMMFSGQGVQYPLMGAQLAESVPEFKELFYSCLAKCDRILQGSVSLQEILNNPENHTQLLLTSHMQPLMFCFCYALGQLWKILGVRPDFFLGHSVGELVAGVHAGAMTLDEGIELIVARAKAMEKINGSGAMLAVDSRASDEVLAKFDVSVAAVNSPKQVVIAGRKGVLDEVLSFVKGKQLQTTFVNTMYPFHSSLITEEDLLDLRQVLRRIHFKPMTTPIVSNVTGKLIREFSEEYLIKHTVSAVKFVDCTETLVGEGVKIWLEAGPSATLCQFLKRTLKPKDHVILQSIQDKGDDCSKLVETVMELQRKGLSVELDTLYHRDATVEEELSVFPTTNVLKLSEAEIVTVMDHEVKNEILVPGMLQVHRMLLEANRDSSADYFTLSGVRLPSPWKLNQTNEAELLRSNDNRLALEVDKKISCSAGLKLHSRPWNATNTLDKFHSCKEAVDVDGWYHQNATNGLRYGPRFKVLREVKRDASRAVARGTVQEDAFLWPMMDGALHLICLIVKDRRLNEYYIPVSLNEVFVDWNEELMAGQEVTFLAELTAENEKFFQFNSTLIVGGKVVFDAKNVTAVVFKAEQAQSTEHEGIETTVKKNAGQLKTPMQPTINGEISGGSSKTPPSASTLDTQVNGPQEAVPLPPKTTEEVIVVGSAGSFCFASVDCHSLWQQLQLGVTSHRYRHRFPQYPKVAQMDQDIAQWDPEFFGISPKEAEYIDPMQRLLMVMVYRALENAGFPSLPSSTGVYVGQSGMDFVQMAFGKDQLQLVGHLAAGTHGSCMAGRVSHWLKLEGPSMVVDTACSSSFTALSLAAEAISKGQIHMAVVAGIHLILHDKVTQVLANGGMIGSYSKAFDASADGYRRSEGMGVILLASRTFCQRKELSQIARLSNWFTSHNGRSAAIQVPNGQTQHHCMCMSGGFVKEVELHATGTSLGDPIEASAVAKLGDSHFSSVKSHLGHAEGASGMASLMAVLPQIQNQYRLPQLHFSCPNPKIPNLSTRLVGEESDFDRIRINNFGFSGSLVSVTVDRLPAQLSAVLARKFYLLPLSAKFQHSLEEMKEELTDFLKTTDHSPNELAAIYQSRPQHRFRHLLILDFKGRTVTIPDHKEDKEYLTTLDRDTVAFLYGEVVAASSGDLLTKIRLTLHQSGVDKLPDDIVSPSEFYSILSRNFLGGVAINWKAIDRFPTPRSITAPSYKFNNRRFWCLDSAGNDEEKIVGRREPSKDLYFAVKLVEQPLDNRQDSRPVVHVTGSDQLRTVRRTQLLFKTAEHSYSEAASLCQLWSSVDESQDNSIVVACTANNSTFSEWTALLRSLAAEKPLKYQLVSFEKEEELEKELKGCPNFEAVHYRGGKRLVERLERLTPRARRRKVDHLVISGGGGGIGQEIVKHLTPARTTVLSRATGHDLSLHKPLESLPRSADLVVHAAGTVDNALMMSQSEEKFSVVGNIKINGYRTLSQHVAAPEIVLLSSAATILGSAGQANYAFANGRMMSLAQISGKPYQAIHYGPWKDVGMLAGNGLGRIRKQIEGHGWHFLDPEEAVLALEVGQPEMLVFDGHFETILRKNPHLESFLERVVKKPEGVKDGGCSVRDLIVEISGLTTLEEERDTPLMQLGMDSLMMEELRTRIGQSLGVKLSSAELYDNCTLAILDRLVGKRQPTPEPRMGMSQAEEQDDHRVAIIGMSASFSGSANISEYWNSLLEGKESITREAASPGIVSAAGIAPNIDHFDYKFFKLTKDEADALDPQVRVFVQHAYNALESSGYIREKSSLRVGVFAGSEPSDYSGGEEEVQGSLQKMFRSNMKDFVATMTAHALDLNGPAVGVYSACSTSLLAVQQGMNALRLGQIDLAIVGGVSLTLPGQESYEFQEGMVLSRTGQCRPFDANSDGTVRGSAAGCLVLKKLTRAVEDEDPVLSVIYAIGTSNDGALKASFMAPNTRGQVQCIREALAQLNPQQRERIEYAECHGTGTIVGDEIELTALKEAYRRKLMLGSVKANIGHGFAGAGVASIVKAVKILETGLIPPQVNLQKPLESAGGFEFPRRDSKLSPDSLVAVSSFGIGGTNCHLILGKGSEPSPCKTASLPIVLPLSASSVPSLKDIKDRLVGYIEGKQSRLEQVASTLQNHRQIFRCRSAVVVNKGEVREIREVLELGKLSPNNVAYFFSPQGVQYPHVERALAEETGFKTKVKELCGIASRITSTDFEEIMYPRSEERECDIMRPDVAQVAVFIINMATVHQLKEWGIEGEHLLGHSVGEYAAFAYGGVLSEEEAIRLLYERGRLCARTSQAALIAVKGDLPPLLEGVEVSAVLSEQLRCVVGPPEQIGLLEKELESLGVECRELQTERGFHSYMLDPVLGEFEQLAGQLSYQRPRKKIFSGVDGRVLNTVTPEYLRNHMRQPVNLQESLKTLLSNPDIKVIVEVGPAGVLQSLLRENYPNVSHVNTIASRKRAEGSHLWNSLAELWSMGYPVDWQKIYGFGGVDPYCPGYSFERVRCWKERLLTEGHRFYSYSWIAVPETPSATNKSLLELAAGDLDMLDRSRATADVLVYDPQGEDEVFGTVRRILALMNHLGAKNLLIVSSGKPADWQALGPLREFSLMNRRQTCQFILNPDNLPSQDVVNRCVGSQEEVLLITRTQLLRQAYSEMCEIWPSVDVKGVVVVFGGSGTLGASYISVLKTLAAIKTIVVIGRRDRCSLEGVLYRRADITSPEQVEQALSNIWKEQGDIDVVINLAGLATTNSLTKSPEYVSKVLSTKVQGTRNIIAFLGNNTLTLPVLILSSSLSSYLPLQGNSDYAAANSFLDGLATTGHPSVRRIQAVQWPLWKQSSMARGTLDNVSRILARGALTSARGQRAIAESLGLSGCVAFSMIHPARLRRLVLTAQLGEERVEVAPTGETRMDLVRNVWKECLSSEIDEKSNFFDLGGNSLNALRLIWQLNGLLSIQLTVNYVFDHPTFLDFYENLPLVKEETQEMSLDTSKSLPLSYAQENMFLLQMLDPGPQYNIVFVVEFNPMSSLNLTAMTMAVRCLIARQLGLRTAFRNSSGQFNQEVLSLTECYQRLVVQEMTTGQYEDYLKTEKARIFDFETVPLRIHWIRTELGMKLLFNQHHILTDGWSMTVLANELGRLYNNALKNIYPVPLDRNVPGFAVKDRERVFDNELLELKEKLRGVGKTQVLRDPSGDAGGYGKVSKYIPDNLIKRIRCIAKELKTTEFIVCLSAYLLTLRRWKSKVDEDELVVGIPVSGRDEQSKDLIGYFLNNLVLRVDLKSEQDLKECIRLVEMEFAEARRREHVPFYKLVAALGQERSKEQHPVFQMYFNYRHTLDYPRVDIDGHECELRQVSMNTLFDLSTTIDDTPKGLRVMLEYNRHYYGIDTVEQFANDIFRCLLDRSREFRMEGERPDVPRHPSYSNLKCIPESEDHLPDLFFSVCQEFAQNFGQATRPDSIVALDMTPNSTAKLIPTVIASGLAYAPVDPTWPDARKRVVAKKLSSALWITEEFSSRIRRCRSHMKLTKNHPVDLAYLIHTSGSTGSPKGVAVSHKNLNTFLTCATRQMLLNTRSRVYNSVNTVFDVSVSNILGTAVNGSRLVLHSNLMNQLEEARYCSYVFLTSAVFNSLTEMQIDNLLAVERLFVGGESIQEANVQTALEKGLDVTQIYGPTEGTIWSLTNRCKREKRVGNIIGTTMAMEAAVVSGGGSLGELVLEGDKVARGYLYGPAFNGIYRTKDLVRLKRGRFLYLGRLDDQVKIRGNRVELQEVEEKLLQVSGARMVVVQKDHESLVACLLSPTLSDSKQLKTQLEWLLPAYSIPSAFVSVHELPRNSSGKIDKPKLLQEFHRQMRKVPNPGSTEDRDIVNSVEQKMLAVYAKTLNRKVTGLEENFFNLGGHSLLLLTLQQNIKEYFGVEVVVSELFSRPTVAGAAALVVDQLKTTLPATDTSIVTKLREVPTPKFNLYLIHAVGGAIFPYYAFLQIFPKDISIYAIEYQLEYKAETLKELAALYAKAVSAHTKNIRPFVLGHSMGGTISREMIPDLRMWGWEIPFVVMFDSWILRPDQLKVEKIRQFMESVFAPLPNAAERVEKAVKLAVMLKAHRVTKSWTKVYLFKSKELGVAAFREAVRPDLNEELSRSLVANGFERVSHQSVTTWMINGDHESCLKVENLKTRQKELLSIFQPYL